MAIRFTPNDPNANYEAVLIDPSPERDPHQATFVFVTNQSREFYEGAPAGQGWPAAYWQCREAAYRAVEAWEVARGSPIAAWTGVGKTLPIEMDCKADLSSYYKRRIIELNYQEFSGGRFSSTASADVVAHEVGHAVLDAMAPGLWPSEDTQINAFHEAFADCSAVLTAFADPAQCVRVLPRLRGANPVETFAESVAAARRLVDTSQPNAEPRHARNELQWNDGDLGEAHIVGQIFAGCFYDLIVGIYEAGPRDAAGLARAAVTAGGLLANAVKGAVPTGRFFEWIGRQMAAPKATSALVIDAFAQHGIYVGGPAQMHTLTSAAPQAGRGGELPRRLRAELSERIGNCELGAWEGGPHMLADRRVVRATHHRTVPLGAIDRRLAGVVAVVPESVLLDDRFAKATVINAMPEADATVAEVGRTVRALLAKQKIAFPHNRKKLRRLPPGATHTIEMVDGQRTLVQKRIACP